MTQAREFDAESFRDAYLEFMQTPNSHNDCYAVSAHRAFFKNLKDGKDPKRCPSAGNNVDSIDALTNAIPVIIEYFDSDRELRNQKVLEAIKVTRNTRRVDEYAKAMSDMMVDIIHGRDLREVCLEIGPKFGIRNLKQMVD